MLKTVKLNKAFFSLFAVIFLFATFFNLDNLAIPRQGTEGFYLKILKEMTSENSYLTPLYLGEPHWSKPPIHFWMALPFSEVFRFNAVFAGRLSVLLVSLSLLFYISKQVSKINNSSYINLFTFLLISFGTIKFFRIYMMEMSLALGITATAVQYFTYFKSQKFSDLLIAAFFGSLACLVKGPVALGIIFFSISIFHGLSFLSNKSIDWRIIKNFSLFIVITLFISSLWFIQQYVAYGKNFIDYFFLRENFGKFATKKYSAWVIVQGLLLYSIPWIFLLRPSMFKFKNILKNDFDKYVAIFFLVSFFIWFIPTQRSHHYAMPSLYFFLILIFNVLNFEDVWSKRIYLSFFMILNILAVLLILVGSQLVGFTFIIVSIVFVIVNFVLFRKFDFFVLRNLCVYSIFAFIWYAQIPNLALPIVSADAREYIDTVNASKIYVIHRKPLFVEEEVNRELLVTDQVKMHEIDSGSLIIAPTDFLNSDYLIKHSWPTWKRGIKFNESIDAITSRNYEPLYVHYSLALKL